MNTKCITRLIPGRWVHSLSTCTVITLPICRLLSAPHHHRCYGPLSVGGSCNCTIWFQKVLMSITLPLCGFILASFNEPNRPLLPLEGKLKHVLIYLTHSSCDLFDLGEGGCVCKGNQQEIKPLPELPSLSKHLSILAVDSIGSWYL